MHISFIATGDNADKISYFLGKNPNNPYLKETKYGKVELRFLEYNKKQVEVFLTFHPNGLALVKDSEFKGLEDYINDREFSISSIFLTNIRKSIGYVLNNTFENVEFNSEDINAEYDFNVTFGPLTTNIPNEFVESLFTDLDYQVSIKDIGLDYDFNIEINKSLEINLKKKTNITSLFKHLYVLIPVIDNYKHHFISNEEVEKLLRYGDDWLKEHPSREFISKRFVGYKQSMFNDVMQQLHENDEKEKEEVITEKKIGLGKQRYDAFNRIISSLKVESIVDMGAGEGRLIELLAKNKNLKELIAVEPTSQGRRKMHERIKMWMRKKIINIEPEVIQSSLFYKDDRLKDKDCIALCEVIEHINIDRIDNVMSIILNYSKPKYFVISTPNFEYNVLYETMTTKFRHSDHRFEMTRNEFEEFIDKHSILSGYSYEIIGVGDEDNELGYPTQMAVMKREDVI